MRHCLLFTALLLTLASGASAADGLFSEVPIKSVFTPSAGQAASLSGAAENRFTGIGAISDALRAAKFEPKEVGDGVVSIQLPRAGGPIPALVSVSADQQQIWLVLLLGSVADEKTVPADKLLALLAANRDTAPALFAYSAKRQRVELYQILTNQGLSPAGLLRELEQLAATAEKHQSLWNFSPSSATAPAATAPATTPASPPAASTPSATPPAATTSPASTSAASTSNLVGKWAAARSDKEAFALQLAAKGTFVLVHVRDGKTNRSTGKFTLEKATLTLIGDDGSRLSGSVQVKSAREFQLQLSTAGSQPLSFQRGS